MTRRWIFHRSGGSLCLDLANTVSWRRSHQPIERLPAYGDLVEWARQSGILTAPAARALEREGRRQSARRHGPRACGPRIPRRAPAPSSYPGALRAHAGVVARRRAAARPSAVGGGALGRGHADLGQSSAAQDMPGLELRLDLPGHHQERYAAVVRHAGVWQPGQGPELLRPPPGFAESAQDIGRGSRAAAPRRSTATATRVGRA